MNKKIFTAAAVLAVGLLTSGCSDVDEPERAAEMIANSDSSSTVDRSLTSDDDDAAENKASDVDTTASEDGILLLTDEASYDSAETYAPAEMIPAGLWWAVNEHVPGLKGETREDSYYQMTGSGTGTVTYQSSGQSVAFRTELNGDHIDMFFEGQDVATPLSIKKVDEKTLEVSFGGNATENWSNMGQMTLEEFGVISNSKLCDMAKESFKTEDGKTCGYTESHIDDTGNIVIDLYDTVEDKNLLDSYTVARFNGMGTNKEGKPIYLTEMN